MASPTRIGHRGPLTESIAVAVSRLVDDGRTEAKREPTHYDLDVWVERFGLSRGDPKSRGETVGKFKRVRGALCLGARTRAGAGGAGRGESR